MLKSLLNIVAIVGILLIPGLITNQAIAQTVTYSSFADLGNEIGDYSNVGTADANTFVKNEAGTRTETETVVTGYGRSGPVYNAQSGEVVGCPSFWGGWKRNVNPHTCLKSPTNFKKQHRHAITATVETTINTVTTTTKVLEYQFDAPDDEKVKITTTVNTVDVP